LLGFALAIVFSVALVLINVANLRHLVTEVEGGWLAFALLCFFNGIVFAGVQFAITIMRMSDGDDHR
jgi:TRAP-type C4-dicarboxylate transport system permease small subunit